MAITKETLDLVAKMKADLVRMSDEQVRVLTAAWVDAWDVLLPQFEAAVAELMAAAANGKVPYAVAARNVRLTAALQASRQYLETLQQHTNTVLTQDLYTAVFDAVDAHKALVTSQLPPSATAASVGWQRVPEHALMAIVERTTQQIHAATLPLPAEVVKAMKGHLVRGIAVGEHPNRVAAKLIKQVGSEFNGGLNRAMTIARTEMLDAHREASKAADKRNKEVLAEWEWNAKLDARTCPSCISKHGSRHPLDESGPLDHQCGRCARVPVTKTWKELGFDIKEPASATPNAEAWFDNLTPATQKAILGETRLQLLQNGDITWADLSTRRETPGWRDSYHVTPVKDLLKEK